MIQDPGVHSELIQTDDPRTLRGQVHLRSPAAGGSLHRRGHPRRGGGLDPHLALHAGRSRPWAAVAGAAAHPGRLPGCRPCRDPGPRLEGGNPDDGQAGCRRASVWRRGLRWVRSADWGGSASAPRPLRSSWWTSSWWTSLHGGLLGGRPGSGRPLAALASAVASSGGRLRSASGCMFLQMRDWIVMSRLLLSPLSGSDLHLAEAWSTLRTLLLETIPVDFANS